MDYRRGRFSWILRPILIIYDILIINVFAYYWFDFNAYELYFFPSDLLNNKHLLYVFYSSSLWLLSSYVIKYYNVYRFSSVLNIISLIIKQFLVFTIIVYAFMGLFRSIDIQAFITLNYLTYSLIAISAMKLLSYYALKLFRYYLKGNARNVIIIGYGENAKELEEIFNNNKDLGYSLLAVFSDANNENLEGTINDSYNFLQNNLVDEIYCAIDELNESQINEYIKYSNIHQYTLKFIPSEEKILNKRFNLDYYSYIPILSIQEVALNEDFNKLIKRFFDISFSLFIIIFILSWVSLILFFLIKIESKGPLFYKHIRNGINYKEFYCYKFRSLKTVSEIKRTYVSQNDERMTRIGKFIRKTSIDELPQFINVLKGDMSVVGPRPHMISFTDDYSKIVDKYNFIIRHKVKPGITGLAQIKGFRGEIETDKDIINRVKYDIFYVENWSLLLDLKIVTQTFFNALRGEDKAY